MLEVPLKNQSSLLGPSSEEPEMSNYEKQLLVVNTVSYLRPVRNEPEDRVQV